jgi:hypothetical protein
MDGLLVISEHAPQIARRTTVGGRPHGPERPQLWISEATAERLLQGSGRSLWDLRTHCTTLGAEQVFELPLDRVVSARVEGEREEGWPVQNVIGYLPGTHSYDYCADCLGKQLIVVMAQYDTPPTGPTGEIVPAANDNASGVAVMLEAIRVLQDADYEP